MAECIGGSRTDTRLGVAGNRACRAAAASPHRTVAVHGSVHELLPAIATPAQFGADGAHAHPGCGACGRQRSNYGSDTAVSRLGGRLRRGEWARPGRGGRMPPPDLCAHPPGGHLHPEIHQRTCQLVEGPPPRSPVFSSVPTARQTTWRYSPRSPTWSCAASSSTPCSSAVTPTSGQTSSGPRSTCGNHTNLTTADEATAARQLINCPTDPAARSDERVKPIGPTRRPLTALRQLRSRTGTRRGGSSCPAARVCHDGLHDW